MPTVRRKASKKSKVGAGRVTRSRPARRVTTGRKKKPAVAKSPVPTSTSLPKLRVRMYRQGLGDCFLLTFNPGDEKHVLIDCGTLGSKYTDVELPTSSTTSTRRLMDNCIWWSPLTSIRTISRDSPS